MFKCIFWGLRVEITQEDHTKVNALFKFSVNFSNYMTLILQKLYNHYESWRLDSHYIYSKQ